MKRFILTICVCTLIALLAGCAQQTAEEKFLSHWEKVVSLVSENAGDVSQSADAVKKYLDDNLEQMKKLGAEFGQKMEKKISENPVFIRRVMKVIEDINTLQEKHPELLGNAKLNEALTPLSAMMQ